MKLPKLNSKALVNVDISDYLIDWTQKRKVSAPQAKVVAFLRPYWRGHIVTEEQRIPGSLLRIDLINWTRRVAVEVSPSGSHSFNAFFHKNRPRFGAAMNREMHKGEWIERVGLKLVEVFDDDLDALSPDWFKSKYDIDL